MTVSAATRFVVRAGALVGSAALVAGFLASSAPCVARADSTRGASLESPVEPFVAVRLFDRPETPYAPGHRGIDIAAEVGQEVFAPGPGVVAFAGVVVDRGVVTVVLADGTRSSVEPVVPRVVEGDAVSAGEVVGVVSDERNHCAPGTCLHWGVRRGGDYVNPLDVLAGFGPVRLLPLDGGSP